MDYGVLSLHGFPGSHFVPYFVGRSKNGVFGLPLLHTEEKAGGEFPFWFGSHAFPCMF